MKKVKYFKPIPGKNELLGYKIKKISVRKDLIIDEVVLPTIKNTNPKLNY